jgi:hypothetical protein
MSVLQGSKNRRQRAWAWAEPPHIVIGTPQELCNMVTRWVESNATMLSSLWSSMRWMLPTQQRWEPDVESSIVHSERATFQVFESNL